MVLVECGPLCRELARRADALAEAVLVYVADAMVHKCQLLCQQFKVRVGAGTAPARRALGPPGRGRVAPRRRGYQRHRVPA